jgi:hypothetical protein
MFDDFCIDQDSGVAYLTTHRQNTIDRFSLEPGENGKERISIAGDPSRTRWAIGGSLGNGAGQIWTCCLLHQRRRHSVAAGGWRSAG